MIERIRGTILKKEPNAVVLDVNGVGLKIYMSINCLESTPTVGKVTQILTYLNVKEDILDLYGFLSDNEIKSGVIRLFNQLAYSELNHKIL